MASACNSNILCQYNRMGYLVCNEGNIVRVTGDDKNKVESERFGDHTEDRG